MPQPGSAYWTVLSPGKPLQDATMAIHMTAAEAADLMRTMAVPRPHTNTATFPLAHVPAAEQQRQLNSI